MQFSVILYLLSYFVIINCASSKQEKRSILCSICNKIVSHIDESLIASQNLSYESGNIEWEKSKEVKYEDSELRFIYIMDGACTESDDKQKCKEFVYKYEDHIEGWFKKQRKENISLFDHLCVGDAKVCCPHHHFGSNCQACLGYIDGVLCSGHGTCIGDGTKKGTGLCECNNAYDGEICDKCSANSYTAPDGSCIPCHKSCDGGCLNYTAEGCLGSCKTGWEKNADGICVDINECLLDKHKCSLTQWCWNTPGKFYCKDCFESCFTCNGDGETHCLTCKPGYKKTEKNTCVDADECADGTHDCKSNTYCMNNVGGFKCEKCNKACLNSCVGPSMADCHDCKVGYKRRENDIGCEDIDECSEANHNCPEGKYCANKPGSFSCKKCDEACHLCHGQGPYSCYSCSTGFRMDKGVCKDITKHIDSNDEDDDSADL